MTSKKKAFFILTRAVVFESHQWGNKVTRYGPVYKLFNETDIPSSDAERREGFKRRRHKEGRRILA
jgi:hypothetical protein